MTDSNLSKLHTFRGDEKATFTVVDGPTNINIEDANKSFLLVLDSSFNPPHFGHYTLIEKALEHYTKNDSTSVHVLLLLSINNADKNEKPATFDKRLDMMCLLSKHLTVNFPHIHPTVAISKSAKFVEKSNGIRDGLFTTGKIVYLLGFDTITRVFDPKYYVPQTVSDAMGEFMNHTDFFCLTRGSDDASDSDFDAQAQYASDISAGKYEPVIPSSWGTKISIVENLNKYNSVSSSALRKLLINGDYKEASKDIPAEIIDYITSADKAAGLSIFA